MYDTAMIIAASATTTKQRAFAFVDRVHELAGVLNRAHAELVELVADALGDDSWAGGGSRRRSIGWCSTRGCPGGGRA